MFAVLARDGLHPAERGGVHHGPGRVDRNPGGHLRGRADAARSGPAGGGGRDQGSGRHRPASGGRPDPRRPAGPLAGTAGDRRAAAERPRGRDRRPRGSCGPAGLRGRGGAAAAAVRRGETTRRTRSSTNCMPARTSRSGAGWRWTSRPPPSSRNPAPWQPADPRESRQRRESRRALTDLAIAVLVNAISRVRVTVTGTVDGVIVSLVCDSPADPDLPSAAGLAGRGQSAGSGRVCGWRRVGTPRDGRDRR